MKFSSLVPPRRDAPRPLVEYLADRFTYYDRNGWTTQIASGKLTIDDRPAGIHDLVHTGQTVGYDPGEFEEPPADLSYSVIYEDEWLLAVNKPGNLLIHRAGKSFRNNLMYQLRCVHVPAYPGANSIHRLDRQTSGVVLIARTPEIQAEISLQFTARQIEKKYIAFVHGIPSSIAGQLIDKPIGRDTESPIVSKFRIDDSGKDAATRIETCVPVGTSCAQLGISPLTGRTHQIRVHCASIGHPVVGDLLYGSDMHFPGPATSVPAGSDAVITSSRHALHCAGIVFMHPWKKVECCIEAPLPHDMLAMKKILENK